MTYRLFWNEEDFRWDLCVGATGDVVVTRSTRQTRRASEGAPESGAEGYSGARRTAGSTAAPAPGLSEI
jgi:hypothetical protein